MSKFLEIHVIQNLPPSNINRDDTGAPKSAVYGGTNRLRVSSQAWKRATREEFAHEIERAQRATRTKRVVRLVAERIMESATIDDEATAATLATDVLKAAGVVTKPPKAKKGEDLNPLDDEAEALFFISNQQVDNLAQLALASAGGEVDKRAAKQAIDRDHGIEIALFGRMAASSPDLNVDAAVQVAHAISTHTIDPQGDFYTAVDDEKGADEDSGAGMMGIIEFASATLYRYAAINLDLLLENLGDLDVTGEAVRAFLRGFVMSLPSGKKNSMAADTLPSAVVVMLRDNRPVSLVGAFEAPVPASETGYVSSSVARLVQTGQATAEAFGLPALRTWTLSTPDLAAELGALSPVEGLVAVADEVREAVVTSLLQEQQ